MSAVADDVVTPPRPPASPPDARARFSWALFDWAQQPYFTLVGAFIFKPFFASTFVGDPVRGQALVGYAGGGAALLVAFLSPAIGAAVDRGGRSRAWLAGLSVPFVLACAGLWFADPATPGRLPLIVACLVAAAVCAELTTAVNNAMLPGVARAGELGRLSGSGVALGYLGGLLAVGAYLAGFTFAKTPWLGLDAAAHETDRIVGPFVAVWYLAFLAPLLLWGRDGAPGGGAVVSWSFVRAALARATPRRRFLLGRTLVADGLTAAAVFGGVLAAGLFDWGAPELGAYGLGLVIVAGASAWGAGRLEGRLSSRALVLGSIALLAVAVAGVSGLRADAVFGLPVAPPTPHDGFMVAPAERIFMALGLLIGVATGPLQAAMRAWMAELIPAGEEGRWFGLFAFSNKATAFAAPLTIAALTQVVGAQSVAMPVIVLFLAAGWVVLQGVPAAAR